MARRLATQYVLGDMVRLEQGAGEPYSQCHAGDGSVTGPRLESACSRPMDSWPLQYEIMGQALLWTTWIRSLSRFTPPKVRPGAGLGLSISYRIIESLDGQLSVANHPDGGAVFTLLLPVCDAPQGAGLIE